MKPANEVSQPQNCDQKPSYEELVERVKYLEEREARYKSLADNTSDLFYRTDKEGQIIYLSKSAYALSGYTHKESLGLNMAKDIYQAPEERDIFIELLQKHGRVKDFEARLKRKDGSTWWAMTNAHLYHDENGNVAGVEGVTRDITARKMAENKLRDNEHTFKTIFKTSPDAITLTRISDGRYIDINDSFMRIMGYQPEDIIGKTALELNIWKNNEDRCFMVEQLLKNNFIENLEAEFLTKQGNIKHGLMSASLIEIASEQIILAVTRDMTDRKQAEEDIAFMDFAIDHIHEGVFLTDKTGSINYVNNEACRELGYSKNELTGMSIWDIDHSFSPARWSEFWNEFISKKAMKLETNHCRKDGSIFPILVNANYLEYNGNAFNLGLVTNITENKKIEEQRQRLEEQMMQAQKLESLEVLAGGVAHDFNNLLAAIMGHSELTKRRLPPGSAAIENLHQIEKAAERAADLAKQMLAYSGRGKFVLETLDLNFLLEEMLHMLQVSISKKIGLRLQSYKSLPTVNVDATQIRQIVMNLVINAAEAIGDSSGTISITTGLVDCDSNYLRNAWLNEMIPDGLYVYLEVADTGCGMTEDTLAKIFDPFFTTKFTGRGLGMSAVLGIVRGHKGAIKVYSEPGKGTSFKILLPASERSAELFDEEIKDDNWIGSGKVLLADDEENARNVGLEMLKELGFHPMTAADGQEALDIYCSHPDIDVVMLDLTMPKMDGEQCFRELKKINPAVKVIISSGYNEFEVSQKFVGKNIAAFVQKPYKYATLKDAIRTLIEAKETDTEL